MLWRSFVGDGAMPHGELLRISGQSQPLRQFFRIWMQNPAAIGAIVPSGPILARAITRGLGPGSRVIELGAGTGCVTQAILDRGVATGDLTIVERDPSFCALLQTRFASCRVLEADARSLEQHFKELGTFDCVVSSLPLLLFAPDERAAVIESAFALLKPDGVLQQFTYGARCPVEKTIRRALGLNAKLFDVVALNLPPAFLYRIERRPC